MMADIRGSLGLALASIRAYLLTAEGKFVERYTALWAKNERHFDELANSMSLLSPEQIAAFDEFKAVRIKFAPLPPRMLELRASKKWNMANYLLVTEAIPRVDKLLTILAGVVH
ncbi:MAG: hypothetical protein VCD66_03230 [Alphaproteobacteria bacterium]